MENLLFFPRDPSHPDAVLLLNALSDALLAITGCDGRASFDAEDMRGAGAAFLVAYCYGKPIACGGFRPLQSGTAEVKRVYARVHGAGMPLLGELEMLAKNMGYVKLVCETRRVNTRAVAFYLRAGWRETEHYGKYIGRDDAVCFGKQL